MIKLQLERLLTFTFVLIFSGVEAQQRKVENSLFWEVRSKSSTEPSYLFGTFHLLGSEYIDSLAGVKAAFTRSKTFAGEMIFESSMTEKMMRAGTMTDTTLQDLLTPEEYAATEDWMKELSGMGLGFFNRFNPAMIQMMITAMLQQKLNGKQVTPMDLYFQDLAKEDKQRIGLETFEDQIKVLFESGSYKQQARHLAEFVSERKKSGEQIVKLNKLYRDENLSGLMEMFFNSSYSSSEQRSLLDDRNEKWMQILPQLFRQHSTFVAVGALHLPGENGLVNLLRRAGYTVTPIDSRQPAK